LRQPQKIATEIFESRVTIHYVFIFIFLALFCSPAIFSHVPATRIFNIILLGIFLLLCIYAGRWLCRKWLFSTKFARFAWYSAFVIIIFSVAGVFGLKQFSRGLSAGMIIAVVCVVTGFSILGTILSISRSALLSQLRENGMVKPFSLERFIAAMDNAIANLNSRGNKEPADQNADNYLFIKAEGKIYKINHDELLYAEAQGNYTKVVTENRVIMPNISFTNFEKMLPAAHFTRVHRSFIVNKSKIDHIDGNRLFIHKSEISIGSNYRESFLKSLGC
jgi:hypothetical protein